MELDLIDARDARALSIWRDLAARMKASYFLSAPWVEAWLAALPDDALPRLAVTRDGSAACWIGRRDLRHHGLLARRAVFLNATGIDRYDALCIEHNKILGNGAAFIASLPSDWDELFLSGVDATSVPALAALRGYRVRIERESQAPFVDLDAVRGSESGYLALLPVTTRNQLRLALRVIGDLELEIARDLAEALDIYGELLRLHARDRATRGERGAFADPWFEHFHRRLITSRIATGEIQLARVRAGTTTVGCLYNLVYNGRIVVYQSGLRASEDPRVEPAWLCHAALIDHVARAGHHIYDLLDGTTHRERSLATGSQRLLWLRVQRQRRWFGIEQRVRGWTHALSPARLALRSG
jgi:hypothetical protein